eukprot:1143457-Pelagomonas_calceolata.AAC.1
MNIKTPHFHLIESRHCEDTRPGALLEASKHQHSELCKQIQGTLHTILLGVGGTIYTAHTLDPFKQLGIDPQRSTKLARKLHAHSVQYAQNLPLQDVQLNTKKISMSLVPWGRVLPGTHQTHTSFPLTLW